MILDLGDDHVRVRVGGRTIILAGVMQPEGPGGPDFVVALDAIEHWEPPHETVPLSLDDIRKVTEAAEAGFDARGLTVEFE